MKSQNVSKYQKASSQGLNEKKKTIKAESNHNLGNIKVGRKKWRCGGWKKKIMKKIDTNAKASPTCFNQTYVFMKNQFCKLK